MAFYFAYGSNIDPERMKKRRIGFASRTSGVLMDYRLEFNKAADADFKEGKANIVPDEDGRVEGALYEVDEEALTRLDKFEGRPDHYDRFVVKICTREGLEVKAEAYVANPEKVKSGLKPSREYLDHLLVGKDLMTEEYYNRLKSVETLD